MLNTDDLKVRGLRAVARGSVEVNAICLGVCRSRNRRSLAWSPLPWRTYQRDLEADGGDLDVSDEMEEIRELLYELIKSNFPSDSLWDIFSYESCGMGPPLRNDWLEHIRVAEEFEVVNRGPIVMVYTHISKAAAASGKPEKIRIRLTDRELAQQMKSILAYSPVSTGCAVSVIVVACDDANAITVQLASSRTDFEQLRANMDAHYSDQQLVELGADFLWSHIGK
uniref:Uncharacterized protein n=1 Tax=Parascaris equorum TaxID=6256 RepID=A0A914RJP8_PAREQ